MNALRSLLARLSGPKAAPDIDGHHPAFAGFRRFEGDTGPFVVCALGARMRPEFVGLAPVAPTAAAPAWPEPCEEYFEWIDVLEAVATAKGSFTMLELGAGFGRWAVRGAMAARQRGLTVKLGLAEAEPQHVAWLRQHLEDNRLGPDEAVVYPLAVAEADGSVVFCVQNPGEGDGWYGQSIVGGGLGGFPVVGDYFGSPLIEFPGGARVIEVAQRSLSGILDDYDQIDLIDFDLQGAEARAIGGAIHKLSAKVRRMHIGTHGRQIEAELRDILSAAGWTCIRDYGCQQENDTPYGRHMFNDGIQTWWNTSAQGRRRWRRP